MKKLNILLACAASFCFLQGKGQDFHLSQYDAAPLYLNPSLTGMYFGEEDDDFRINAGYRNQWGSIAQKPFTTAYLSYDMNMDRFGAGGFLINNRSGTGNLNSLSFFASGSYSVTNLSSPHKILTGLQLGLFHKSFDPTKFTYDSQYSESEGGFDSGLSSGETFERNSKLNFDANVGVYYRFLEEGKRVSPYFGFTIFHATRPNESFTVTKSKIPMRFLVNGGAQIKTGDNLVLEPVLLFMHQADAREINGGLRAWYEMKDSPYKLLAGFDYRVEDAMVFHLGIKYFSHLFRISYDHNFSYLNAYTKGRGGFELSLILMGSKGKPLIRSPKY